MSGPGIGNLWRLCSLNELRHLASVSSFDVPGSYLSIPSPARISISDVGWPSNFLGGKGTPRRKVIKTTAASSGANDQKLQGKLKGLNVQAITGVEEVNMFKDDGNVLHFTAPKGVSGIAISASSTLTFSEPKVHAALPSNTMAIYGHGQNKELTELVPNILSQLGPDSLASLRKLAAQYQSQTAAAQAAAGVEGVEAKGDDDDDDIPDLVESFEPDEKEKEKEAEPEVEAKEPPTKEEEENKDVEQIGGLD